MSVLLALFELVKGAILLCHYIIILMLAQL